MSSWWPYIEKLCALNLMKIRIVHTLIISIKKVAYSTLTFDMCTGKAGEQPVGEPKWWNPGGQKAEMRGRVADKGGQQSGHTGWGRSRGLGSAGASPVRWPHKRPGVGPGASRRETPGSTTCHPGSADRHWSMGWCRGPSLPFFYCSFSLFFLHSFTFLSPHPALSANTHIHSTINHKSVQWLHEQKKVKSI